jgi:hypothetical protein
MILTNTHQTEMLILKQKPLTIYLVVFFYEFPLILDQLYQDSTINNDARAKNVC